VTQESKPTQGSLDEPLAGPSQSANPASALLVVNPTLGGGFQLPGADHLISREVEALCDDQKFTGRA
jgi:hypothetical protein